MEGEVVGFVERGAEGRFPRSRRAKRNESSAWKRLSDRSLTYGLGLSGARRQRSKNGPISRARRFSLSRKRVLGVGSVAHKLPVPRARPTRWLSRGCPRCSHVNKGWIHLHTFSSRIRWDKTNPTQTRDGVVPRLLLFFTTVRVARAGGRLPNDGHERLTTTGRGRMKSGVVVERSG